mgnify:CR=1 FL=1
MGKEDLISKEMLGKFTQDFKANPQYRVIMNAIIKNGIDSSAINQKSLVKMQYTFSNEMKIDKITNQKQSGRCWLFAGLNVLRQKVIEKNNLKDFELSQNYQMFWDKLEKANYFLDNILETAKEKINSRIIMWLLSNPLGDGGQWDMFLNLIEKYGVVPKYVMPETFHSSQSARMNQLLTVKLREDAAILRESFHKGEKIERLRSKKETMLREIHRMLCCFLGEPPEKFDFEYRDKDKKFHRDRNLTPIDFFQKYVDTNIHDYVSIINAPTKDKPFEKTYTVKYLGNVKGGKDVLYLNVDIETLKSLAVSQLKEHELVWFGCDVGKMMDRDSGIMDTNLYNFDLALDTSFNMTKAERLDYGESRMTHAMVFTGINLVDGKPNRWKVENSWGDKKGEKGFFIMSNPWFDEFMYQIVINKKYLSDKLQQALEEKPIELSPWDPMGSLALMK